MRRTIVGDLAGLEFLRGETADIAVQAYIKAHPRAQALEVTNARLNRR